MLRSKDARLLLRMTDEMAAEVRTLADSTERSISGELRRLIRLGLEHEAGKCGKDTGAKKRQLLSTGGNSEKERSA